VAWNPSPEVAVARDAADRLAKCAGVGVRQVVILYVTDDGRLGLSTYGRTKQLCGVAGHVGDKLYELAMRLFSR
jgi:hypothetical protein